MSTRLYAILAGGAAAAAVIGIGAFVTLGDRESAAARCNAGTAGGEMGGPFELVSETGETVTSAEVITGPSLVYFGYTFCPDVCPLDAVRNAEAVEILAERGIDTRLQPEHLSTVEARRRARAAGRRRGEPVDDLAAQIILEEYLARRAGEAEP